MATYYVRPDGNDSNTGLVDSAGGAFLTISRANTVMSGTGNTVYVADGTYSGGLSLSKAGASGALNSFIAQGSGAVISGGSVGVTLSANYVKVQGFEVTAASSMGIYSWGAYQGIQVVNCDVHHTGSTTDSNALFFYQQTDTLISGCTVHHNVGNGIQLGDHLRLTLSNSDIHSNGNDAVVLGGGDANIIEGNTVYDHIVATGGVHGDGIVLQGAPYGSNGNFLRGTIIRNNVISDCGQMVYVNSFGNDDGILDTEVYGNVFYHGVLESGHGVSIHPQANLINGLDIHNNTFVGINSNSSQGISYRSGTAPDICSNLSIKDNILFDSHLRLNPSVVGGTLTVDNNLYFNSDADSIKYIISWGSDASATNYTSLAAFQAATIYEDNGRQGDPLLNADYTLQAGSPAIRTSSDGGDIGAYPYRTYYVATTGSSGNSGLTVDAPKATIAQALALITTGTGPHTIYVADGTYTGGISLNKAGISGGLISVVASGGGAIISGGSIGVTFSAHYVKLQGFEITGFTDNGIYANRRNYCEVRDCDLHDGGGGNPDTGIRFEECQYATVDNNTVIDINGNGLYFIDCSYCTMSNNEVTRAYPDGISLSGIYNTCEYNTVTEMDSGSAHGDGIIVACPEWSTAPYLTSLDTVGTIIRYNTIKNCTQYLYLDAYNYSNSTVRAIVDTEIYGNTLYGDGAGYTHQGISIDPETENIDGLNIHHNTIVGMSTAGNGGGQGIAFGARTGCTLTGLVIKDNILYDSALSRNNGTVTVTDINNNLHYRTGTRTLIHWSPTNGYYSTLAQFQAATIYEDNGIEDDPLFVNAVSDWNLQAGSPAIGTDSTGTGDIGAHGDSSPQTTATLAPHRGPKVRLS